jgi:hypothetical protein
MYIFIYLFMLFRQRSCKRQVSHPNGPTNCIKDPAVYNNTKTEQVKTTEYKQQEEETIKIQ